jgi:hypothetical protein
MPVNKRKFSTRHRQERRIPNQESFAFILIKLWTSPNMPNAGLINMGSREKIPSHIGILS